MKAGLGIIMLLLLATSPALAQLGVVDTSQNAGKPIDITADDLTLEPKKQLAVFTGNVDAKQGNFRLQAQRMEVYYHEGSEKKTAAQADALSRVVATGGVILSLPSKQAKAERGVYDVDKGKVELTGKVVLIRDQHHLEGDRFTYDVAAGRSQLLSRKKGDASASEGASSSGGRVRGVFMPKGKE